MTTTACDDQFAPEPSNRQRLEVTLQLDEYPVGGRAQLSTRARQTIAELWHQCSELRAERYALAAHVKRLKRSASELAAYTGVPGVLPADTKRAYEAFKAAPETSLAKHDAELLEKAINEFAEEIWTEMLKHHRAIKVLPLSMARTYLDRRMMAEGGKG